MGKQHEVSHSLELQLRSCEYDALINACKGIKTATKQTNSEEDLFGVTGNGGDSVSASVVNAAKEALSRMPVVDLKVLRKRQEDAFGTALMPSSNLAETSATQSGGD